MENMMNCRAVMDRVFIKLERGPEVSESGIILMSDYPIDRTIGEVVSVGERVSSVKKGDKVLFHVFDELKGPSDDVVVVRENSILGVIVDE